MELFGLLVAELHGETFQNVMVPGKLFIPVSRKWIEDGTLDNIFRVLSLEAELTELSIDASIVKAHQHSAGAKKGGHQTKSDTAVVEPAQKVHAVVDAYGYPVYFMIREGQRNDINYAIPLLDHVNLGNESTAN